MVRHWPCFLQRYSPCFCCVCIFFPSLFSSILLICFVLFFFYISGCCVLFDGGGVSPLPPAARYLSLNPCVTTNTQLLYTQSVLWCWSPPPPTTTTNSEKGEEEEEEEANRIILKVFLGSYHRPEKTGGIEQTWRNGIIKSNILLRRNTNIKSSPAAFQTIQLHSLLLYYSPAKRYYSILRSVDEIQRQQ